eukprot:2583195-Prymnesium_polylepis.1
MHPCRTGPHATQQALGGVQGLAGQPLRPCRCMRGRLGQCLWGAGARRVLRWRGRGSRGVWRQCRVSLRVLSVPASWAVTRASRASTCIGRPLYPPATSCPGLHWRRSG